MRYLIVGAGLSGITAAHKIHELDKDAKVDIIERRNMVGGNCASEVKDGIAVHTYGPHIFHTNDKKLWDWFSKLANLVPYSHQVKAKAPDGKLYSLPFSLQTAYEMFGARTPQEFEAIRQHEIDIWKEDRRTLDTTTAEGFAVSRLGTTMYMQLVRGYTEKQWGRTPANLPASIVGRLPIRDTFDVGYYSDKYVGIPADEKGYMPFFYGTNFRGRRLFQSDDWRDFVVSEGEDKVDAIIYTGAIDEYFDFKYGKIEYRTSTWSYEEKPCEFSSGIAVLNYTDRTVPTTRRIEYRYLQSQCNSPVTHIAYERSENYRGQKQGPMYIVPSSENQFKINKYAQAGANEVFRGAPVLFLGRLAQSKYLDMSTTIENAWEKVPKFVEKSFKKIQ